MANGPVLMLMRLVWMSRIPIRNPTYRSPLSVVQTLACHPTSLGVDYQRDGMAQHVSFYCHSDELIVL